MLLNSFSVLVSFRCPFSFGTQATVDYTVSMHLSVFDHVFSVTLIYWLIWIYQNVLVLCRFLNCLFSENEIRYTYRSESGVGLRVANELYDIWNKLKTLRNSADWRLQQLCTVVRLRLRLPCITLGWVQNDCSMLITQHIRPQHENKPTEEDSAWTCKSVARELIHFRRLLSRRGLTLLSPIATSAFTRLGQYASSPGTWPL